MKYLLLSIVLPLTVCVPGLPAGEVAVLDVTVSKGMNKKYNFEVTVEHADTGWNHYSNKWDIVDEEGTIRGTRILHHPHVNEQPFTRSLLGVEIPENIKKVKIRAHDTVHGYGGKIYEIDLP